MNEPIETAFDNKCQILAELWMERRDDEDFEDFIEYNDLGLPLAYAVSNGIVEASAMAKQFINETFRLLLAGLEIYDRGFEELSDVLDTAEEFGGEAVDDDDDNQDA